MALFFASPPAVQTKQAERQHQACGQQITKIFPCGERGCPLAFQTYNWLFSLQYSPISSILHVSRTIVLCRNFIFTNIRAPATILS